MRPHWRQSLFSKPISLISNFRIFIDAATLKESEIRVEHRWVLKFPHLYRCVHIEGCSGWASMKLRLRKTNKKSRWKHGASGGTSTDNINEKAMTMDSTTSELMQDNSNEWIFWQKHNDIDCALCPPARRACDSAWVTAKQIENWSGMTKGCWLVPHFLTSTKLF